MNITRELLDFIDASPSQYHVVENSKKILLKNDFEELKPGDKWELKKDGRYFLINNDSSILAFHIGRNLDELSYNIIGSHSDSPGFRIKPNPELEKKDYVNLNVEVYGGPIISTWLDRPLSIAGRVVISDRESFKPESRLVNIDRDLLIIPNLAIHMNREINQGYKYDVQRELLPLISLDKDFKLEDLLREELKLRNEEILGMDLYLYDRCKGSILGSRGEFYSVGKIDNLAAVYTSLKALMEGDPSSINLVYIPDNEEVGSSTRQGAASPFLRDNLKRIAYLLGWDFEGFIRGLSRSFLISADQSHGFHPSYPEKNDLTNFPILNGGPTIKTSANKSYTSDGLSSSKIKALARINNIKLQNFVNHSNLRGGSTIGPIITSNLDIESVDLGNPVLSMHSVRELGGVQDLEYLFELFKAFFKEG